MIIIDVVSTFLTFDFNIKSTIVVSELNSYGIFITVYCV